jgi:Zn finger protein HypA/HybF involved in hydrogenase expression
MAEAMALLLVASDELRLRIKSDWPKASSEADANGQAMHPLSKAVASEWYCLHCDTKSTGVQLAANMWHCPKCSASPLDIHSSAWWKQPA